MSLDGSNCCCCAGKMGEGRHDFMAGAGEAALVVRDVPALICDTCGEVEYTLETSRAIDAIMKDFFGKVAGQAPGGGGDRFQAPAGRVDGMRCHEANLPRAFSEACQGGPLPASEPWGWTSLRPSPRRRPTWRMKRGRIQRVRAS